MNYKRIETYRDKIKAFLFDSFAGLTSSEPWNKENSSGGYIDVNKDGELLYYQAKTDAQFMNYLYENTYFDLPSRGENNKVAQVMAKAFLEERVASEKELDAARYNKDGKRIGARADWGYVFKKEDRYYININFQIRFI